MRRKECLGVKETIEELAPVAGSSSLCAMTIKFLFFFFIFNSFRFSFIHWRCDRLVISLLIAFFLRSLLTAVKGTITTSVFEALIKRFFTFHSHCRERSKWRWKDWKDSPEDQLRMNCCLSCILRYRFRSDTQSWVWENFSPSIVAACWAHLRAGGSQATQEHSDRPKTASRCRYFRFIIHACEKLKHSPKFFHWISIKKGDEDAFRDFLNGWKFFSVKHSRV